VSRQTSSIRGSPESWNQIGAGEQGVVVEHLLEVRHRPGRIDAVPREATADLVVDAAAGHRAQGVQGHILLVPAEQELDDRRLRELRRVGGRASKSPVDRIE
jgi:hypothetical protein